MNRSLFSTAAASLALVLLAGCAGSPPGEAAWDRELPEAVVLDLFGDDPGTTVDWLLVRDAATGRAIEGARVDGWVESPAPYATPWEELRVFSGTTDLDGLVLLPRAGATWIFTQAPGYAPLAREGGGRELRLLRGRDFAMEIRDWRDRPVAGVVVDAFLGCGHNPVVRSGTTDHAGRVTLSCIHPTTSRAWLRAPGVGGESDAFFDLPDGPFLEDGTRVVRAAPSPDIRGRVLWHDGSPVVDAVVGSALSFRGPWTVTGEDGSFVLSGAEPGSFIEVHPPWREGDPEPEVETAHSLGFQSVPGVSVTYRIPAPDRLVGGYSGDLPDAALHGKEDGPGIRVRATMAGDGLLHDVVSVVAVRDGDGVAAAGELQIDGDASGGVALAVAAGTWTVTVGDRAGQIRPVSRTVSVGGTRTDIDFELEENPVWKPRILDRDAEGRELLRGPREGDRFVVTTEDGRRPASAEIDASGGITGALHVPADGPFTVELTTVFGGTGNEVEDPPESRALLVFDGPPGGDARFVIPAPPSPGNSGGEGPEPAPIHRLDVRLPDGAPAAGAAVEVFPARRSAGPPAEAAWEEVKLLLDGEGSAPAPLETGDRWIVTASEERYGLREDGRWILPLEGTVVGPGPWTLRWPASEITVRAVEPGGAPLDQFAVVLPGGNVVHASGGKVVLRGAAAGPLRFLVVAPGRRIRDLRLRISADERRETTVTLGPRAR